MSKWISDARNLTTCSKTYSTDFFYRIKLLTNYIVLISMYDTQAVVEQLTYGPAALASFYFGMSLLEGKSVEQAMEELKLKFLPSYKVSI